MKIKLMEPVTGPNGEKFSDEAEVRHPRLGEWVMKSDWKAVMKADITDAFSIVLTPLPPATKVANSDGTPYEEPAPMPDFGVCWAARAKSGRVMISPSMPTLGSTGLWRVRDSDYVVIGAFSFRPDLPWDKTACKVRVRLEVVND
jgi:hypothetical protein